MDYSFFILCVSAVVIGYLCGSIPFGLLLYKWKSGQDIRTTGSGNIGATNVLRAGGKKLAALTLVLDAAKGAVAVIILKMMGGDQDFSYVTDGGMMLILPWPMALVALSALLGHMYPIWLKFKGGKGVATFLGVAMAMHPVVGAVALVSWLACAFVFKISSLSALVAVALSPIIAFFFAVPVSGFGGGAEYFAWFYAFVYVVAAILIYWKHRSNIARLLKGEEPRIGKK